MEESNTRIEVEEQWKTKNTIVNSVNVQEMHEYVYL